MSDDDGHDTSYHLGLVIGGGIFLLILLLVAAALLGLRLPWS